MSGAEALWPSAAAALGTQFAPEVVAALEGLNDRGLLGDLAGTPVERSVGGGPAPGQPEPR